MSTPFGYCKNGHLVELWRTYCRWCYEPAPKVDGLGQDAGQREMRQGASENPGSLGPANLRAWRETRGRR